MNNLEIIPEEKKINQEKSGNFVGSVFSEGVDS